MQSLSNFRCGIAHHRVFYFIFYARHHSGWWVSEGPWRLFFSEGSALTEKFAPRFDPLRFIEILVTVYR
ncbi:hypothetical protein S83_040069 [Arachis hypogaea]|nr:uncharacterized protein DS421_12g381490 [Arachis hypogaea]